ncbi:hypothetical protein CENSYa_0717 [Cenarchaeum symbiosum A]|uniref:Uncharacterized protein n=1 Tax=Cenarchaeum symbiosum (strain A) TaxID=414004 RepID=A0RVI3_CENSY|nr:hypothetical protein CENSYa_0717 [Cenarchaeum symbiosum A]
MMGASAVSPCPEVPRYRRDLDVFGDVMRDPAAVGALVAAAGGSAFSIYAYAVGALELALAGLLVAPAVVMLVMQWKTRGEVGLLDKTLDDMSGLITSESEKTREILGSTAATLKSIDGKLDRIPGPPAPTTLPTRNGGTCA